MSHAWAEDKLERSDSNEQRSIVALGWLISLLRRSLTISEKSLKKALGYFFSTNLRKKLSLKKLLRLASFARRLTLVHRNLRFFYRTYTSL